MELTLHISHTSLGDNAEYLLTKCRDPSSLITELLYIPYYTTRKKPRKKEARGPDSVCETLGLL